MKRFKPFSSLGRFRRPALLIAVFIGFACGPSFDPSEFMSFFMPESGTIQPEDSRYIFSPQFYNESEVAEQYTDSVVVDENIKAWSTYVGGNLSKATISKAIYQKEPDAVRSLTSTLERNNAAASDYLTFAWAADSEPGTPWKADDTPIDSTKGPQFLDDARKSYRTTNDAFLKERYGFQAVKIACETGDYKLAQQLYDQLISPLPKKTFISDWALSRRAGASLDLSDTSRAIYEFAQVFDRCPSRRKAAETSLRKYGIRFRENALQYAKTDGERAAVYALCAIQPGEDALNLLEEIVRLTPKNPLIELVMGRQINRNEYYFFMNGDEYTRSSFSNSPDSSAFESRKNEAPSYFDKLRTFALESAENKALGNPAFWYTATAYLDYVGHEYKSAQTHLDQAALLPTTNKELKKQITVQRMLFISCSDRYNHS